MHEKLSAKEAAALLGVSLASLYSYVSRGLLRSYEVTGQRQHFYARDQVLHLAARRRDARHGGYRAESAIHWGAPLLETTISQIERGQLFYRGHDAIRLSDTLTIEEVAFLLWNCDQEDLDLDRGVRVSAAMATVLGALPSSTEAWRRLMTLMPLIAMRTEAKSATTLTPKGQHICLLRLMSAVVLNTAYSRRPIHLQIAKAWKVKPKEQSLIRMILVLLAEHELNASSFVVRCVASTGASCVDAITAGLGALSGPRHGGGSAAVRELLLSIEQSPRLQDKKIAEFMSKNVDLLGFGHPLYADGDPRARKLFEALAEISQTKEQLHQGLEVIGKIATQCGHQPNLDAALALTVWSLNWPSEAAAILFMLGRSVGWIAHFLEQSQTDAMIRPRSRYVGNYLDNVK